MFLRTYLFKIVLFMLTLAATSFTVQARGSEQRNVEPGGDSSPYPGTMQIIMHPSDAPKKKVPKKVPKNVTDNLSPLPTFDAPFAQTHTTRVYLAPPAAFAAPVQMARRQPPRPESNSISALPPAAPLAPSFSTQWRPTAWMDYSAVGVITTAPAGVVSSTGSNIPDSKVLDQILTVGVGFDLANEFHLSMDTHLQYASPMDSTNSNSGQSTSASGDNGFSVNDIYGHAVYRVDASPALGAGETLKFDAGALAPFSSEARAESYEAVYVASATLATRLVPSVLTLQNMVEADYIWNRYEYSTITGLAHQEGGAAYRLGLVYRLSKSWEWSASAGAKASPSFDGTVGTRYNGMTTLAYRVHDWLLHLGYSAGTFQEISGQNLWFIDQQQQTLSAGVGIRF